MNATIPPFPGNSVAEPRETHVPLNLVIAQHGAWRVLRAALAALLSRDRHPPPPPDDHLRRDIGLAPLPPHRHRVPTVFWWAPAIRSARPHPQGARNPLRDWAGARIEPPVERAESPG